MHVNCSADWNIRIFKNRTSISAIRAKRHSFAEVSDSAFIMQRRRKRDSKYNPNFFCNFTSYSIRNLMILSFAAIPTDGHKDSVENQACNKLELPMTVEKKDKFNYYSMNVCLLPENTLNLSNFLPVFSPNSLPCTSP